MNNAKTTTTWKQDENLVIQMGNIKRTKLSREIVKFSMITVIDVVRCVWFFLGTISRWVKVKGWKHSFDGVRKFKRQPWKLFLAITFCALKTPICLESLEWMFIRFSFVFYSEAERLTIVTIWKNTRVRQIKNNKFGNIFISR